MNKTFETFIEEFQAAPLTKHAYEQNLKLFDRFLKGAEPDERKVEEYLFEMNNTGLSSATINQRLSAIRAYFLWRKKHAPKNKRGDWDLMIVGPKVHNKIPRLIPSAEILKVVVAAETDYERALTRTLYDAALRIRELMDLQVEDIDFKGMQIKITVKGSDEAWVPVGEKTIEALRKYIGNRQGKVFTQPYYQLNYDLKRLGNRAGVRNLNPQHLLYARAQDLRCQGVDVLDAKEFLRHKRIETTMRYYGTDPKQLNTKKNAIPHILL
jgi:site-specific recombinase XerD